MSMFPIWTGERCELNEQNCKKAFNFWMGEAWKFIFKGFWIAVLSRVASYCVEVLKDGNF